MKLNCLKSELIVPLQTYELNLEESMKEKGFAFKSTKIEFSKSEEHGEVLRSKLVTLLVVNRDYLNPMKNQQ